MVSPLIPFTADEAWDFIPGKPAPSVHLATWSPCTLALTEQEQRTWTTLFGARERVLPELEKARQAKLIGKALEARVIMTSGPGSTPLGAADLDSLRELLNVSQLDAVDGAEEGVQIVHAEGAKCDRCWHWETDVGSDPGHPAICGRRARAVAATG
jgi:isoleucyl-tRNA synthetase